MKKILEDLTLSETQVLNSEKNVKFFSYIYIWLLKNIIFNFKTKLTIEDQFARINITLPTKNPSHNQPTNFNKNLKVLQNVTKFVTLCNTNRI
jgi:hypothetical protein